MDAHKITKSELEYAKEFWTLANAVTAFAIIQMITYLIAVGPSDSKIRSAVAESRTLVIVFIGLATIFYCTIVATLNLWQIDLLHRNGILFLSRKLRFMALTRIVAIVSVSLLGLWATWILGVKPIGNG